MRKHYTLFGALLAAMTLLPANAQNVAVAPHGTPRHAAEKSDAKRTTVLVDEDFSALTDGTEDNPSTTKLLDSMGDFTDPSVLKPYSNTLSFKKWGGNELYAAGGTLAIKADGFLNTPAGDMGGKITLTFRARLTQGTASSEMNALKLMFLSRKELKDWETKEYTLTNEWQNFTFTSTRGEFEVTGFQFFPQTTTTVLVDDIRIEQEPTSIPAPKTSEAEEAGDYSFKAVWEPVAAADYYLLDVYSKSNVGQTATASEGFDAVKASADGSIDADAPGYPEGWTFEWGGDDTSRRIAAGEGTGEGNKQALRFVEMGDAFTTPYCKEGMTSFKMWLKPELNGAATVPYGSYLEISFDTDYGLYPMDWFDVPNMFAPDYQNGGYYDLSDIIANLGEKVYAVKVEYKRADDDVTTVLFDDVTYDYVVPPTRNYVLQGQRIDATEGEESVSYDVTGLDPDKDYFYVVKAANSDFTSKESAEVEVFAVSQPTALPATDITADSYTANWTSNNKVDYYRVDQIQQRTLDKDVDDYEVLYEDFSKVEAGDFTEADLVNGLYLQDEPTSGYMPIDDLTHIAGWKASSTIRVTGWLGGNEATGNGNIAGAIVTPTIDLSHNDGECNVTVRAWGQEDDWLVIQGANQAAYAAIRFPEGGFVEQTVTVPVCSAKEQLTFYSNNYYPFLLDYVKITQNMKAGESVTTITGAKLTDDADTKSMVMDNPGFGLDHKIYYKVTAMRYDTKDPRYYMASTPSELVYVPNPDPAGISTVGATAESVKAANGGVVVNVAEATVANVYNMAGQLVASKACGNGHTFIGLASGIYVVKTAHTTAKVVVK